MSKTIEQQGGVVDHQKLNEERAIKKFCNGIALQLPPSNEVMEAIRLLNKELPLFVQERDRISREEALKAIEKLECKYSPVGARPEYSDGVHRGFRSAKEEMIEALTTPLPDKE